MDHGYIQNWLNKTGTIRQREMRKGMTCKYDTKEIARQRFATCCNLAICMPRTVCGVPMISFQVCSLVRMVCLAN